MRTEAALVALVGLALLALPGSAQTLDELEFTCSGSTPFPSQPLCAPTATGFVGVGRELSISQTGGAALSGSASTLGRRFASTPRVALAGTLGWSRLNRPDFVEPTGEVHSRLVTLDADLAVGLTEGFSPQPTVGGVFAIDLLTTVGVTLVDDATISADPVHWGYGLRFGVLRESFTLPGVSLSVMRVHGGGVESALHDAAATSAEVSHGSIRIEEMVTTSARATVGKEFMALGLLGGIGWDRTELEGSFDVTGRSSPVLVSETSDDRISFFGSISRTWLIASVSLDVQYIRGFDGPAAPDFGEYRPGDGTFRVGLGTRLTF